jgi:hypothetical protein
MKRTPKGEMLTVSISIAIAMIVLTEIAGTTAAADWNSYAREWLNTGYYNVNHEAEYYPFFGEDFFTSGYDQSTLGVQNIEAQRKIFESPFLPYFGEGFLSEDKPYQFTYPWGVFPLYPYSESKYQLYKYPWTFRHVQAWPDFRKNWTATLVYAKSNSSLRVYSGGTWRTA